MQEGVYHLRNETVGKGECQDCGGDTDGSEPEQAVGGAAEEAEEDPGANDGNKEEHDGRSC